MFEVLSKLVQVLWRNGFGQTDGRMDGRTDEAVTICSLLGEHDKQYNYCKNKLDNKTVILQETRHPFFP